MNNDTATILLIDDHPLLRKGLIQLIALEDSLDVIGEADSGIIGIELAKELDPDLIILDLNMHGLDGLETLRIMRAEGVTSRIIMLTVSDNDEDVIQAISFGADGYLLKDMDPVLILEKIKQAVNGEMVISDKLAAILAKAIRKPDASQKALLLKSLTTREFEILKQIAKGLTNKLIARELDITDGTVKVHVKHLLKKLGMRSRVEAAVWMLHQQK
ncbi:two-component system response regulator NarL [Shewanella frigidimarina]|uniref:Two-component system response regulator n=1 Tax=Shewanella frigidimarina TaxID=56812 RepID=A0A106C3G9_SHEFR|nr:two-component system response regulator NarL [Shewanella frigidimarina]KVX03559.1 two-component system response regulator [Shewanella frigidimarina]|tara:strand:- start:27221 stop:27868 length:648 start_codon:yes stop_codon:yes gene_type:complete